METQAYESNFFKKYNAKFILMPFHADATEKSYWILSAKTEKEKAERMKLVMNGKDLAWKNYKPSKEEKIKLDMLIKKSEDAAAELEATGTPALFDSEFKPIKNWPALMR